MKSHLLCLFIGENGSSSTPTFHQTIRKQVLSLCRSHLVHRLLRHLRSWGRGRSQRLRGRTDAHSHWGRSETASGEVAGGDGRVKVELVLELVLNVLRAGVKLQVWDRGRWLLHHKVGHWPCRQGWDRLGRKGRRLSRVRLSRRSLLSAPAAGCRLDKRTCVSRWQGGT